jgi:hypothetical protein
MRVRQFSRFQQAGNGKGEDAIHNNRRGACTEQSHPYRKLL